MKLELTEITKNTTDAVTLRFAKPSPDFTYKPGQHGMFTFTFNDESFIRTYSFSSAPGVDTDLAITVRSIDNGTLSNRLLHTLPARIDLEHVSGDFCIQTSVDTKRHLVMFAAGSGITPILSMIRSVLYHEPLSSLSLVYSNRSFDRIIFRHVLDCLVHEFGNRLEVNHVLTQNSAAPDGYPVFYNDTLSKLVIKKLIRSLISRQTCPIEYYICGPHGFMQRVEEVCQALDIDKTKVFREHFYVPSIENDIDFSSLPAQEVIIQRNDEERILLVDSGRSILQAALANNIPLAHSCTEGQCGMCRSYLIHGEVKLRKNHALTDDEVKLGQILLCQGFPVTGNVVVRPIH